MKFKPSDNYNSLKKQAYSLATLVDCLEVSLATLRKKEYDFSEKKVKHLQEMLDSEKEMNAILTKENQELQERLNDKATTTRDNFQIEMLP